MTMTFPSPSFADVTPSRRLPGVSPDMERRIGYDELARELHVTRRTLYRWVDTGRIPEPERVEVPSTRIQVRMWPASIVDRLRPKLMV